MSSETLELAKLILEQKTAVHAHHFRRIIKPHMENTIPEIAIKHPMEKIYKLKNNTVNFTLCLCTIEVVKPCYMSDTLEWEIMTHKSSSVRKDPLLSTGLLHVIDDDYENLI